MATASKKPPSPSPSAPGGKVLGAIDEIYKFLASLKLAVLSLSGLAAALAFATWFESTYGTKAAQLYVYKSVWFGLLLAFLAINIFCAASIRFPWKRRQTGFVVTHAGLLVLIAGSYVHFKSGDEGTVGMLEGETRNEMLRTDAPMFKVREVDPHTNQPSALYEMPFDETGPFPWGGGQPRIRNIVDLGLNRLSGGRFPAARDEADVLSKPGDPFKLVVKRYLPASAPDTLREASPSGQPMARMLLQFKAPGMPEARLANAEDSQQWFKLDRRFYRTARSDGMPALISFGFVDRPEYVDDFLKPPLDQSPTGVARIRYAGKDGKERAFDFVLETPPEKQVPLPESDLTVALQKLAHFPTAEAGLGRVVGEPSIPIAVFDIRKGDAEPVEHVAMGSMPMFPNVIPRPAVDGGKPPEALARINLMLPPDLDPASSGRFGQVDVLAGPDGKLVHRVFGRGKEGKPELRAAGPIETGKWIDAFGGGAAAMSIGFQVAEYLPSAGERRIFRPVFVPGNKMDEAIPACLVELTVDGKTEEVWIQRSESLDAPTFRPAAVGGRQFEIAYDVDRKPLGFDLKLEDFQVGFEPGTEQATKFVSKVKVEDPSQGVKGEEHVISMNEPMTHRGYTFYQMRYSPIVDPRTNQRTGQFQSVFQVGSNPGRPIIYAGSLLIVLGTFLQFTMRAGLFSDGGRREREKAAKKAGLPPPVEPARPTRVEEDIL